MSILIKDMEMPNSCGECIFHRPLYHTLYCIILNKNCAPHTTIKDFCPLISVPEPHGRLIDADALKDKWTHKDLDLFSQGWGWLRDLNQAPTIIPAEEGE